MKKKIITVIAIVGAIALGFVGHYVLEAVREVRFMNEVIMEEEKVLMEQYMSGLDLTGLSPYEVEAIARDYVESRKHIIKEKLDKLNIE